MRLSRSTECNKDLKHREQDLCTPSNIRNNDQNTNRKYERHPFVTRDHREYLTLKLAGYFATHIQARGGGGFNEPPPRILKRLIISTCPLAYK